MLLLFEMREGRIKKSSEILCRFEIGFADRWRWRRRRYGESWRGGRVYEYEKTFCNCLQTSSVYQIHMREFFYVDDDCIYGGEQQRKYTTSCSTSICIVPRSLPLSLSRARFSSGLFLHITGLL